MSDALSKQVAGSHYNRLHYQPVALGFDLAAPATLTKVAKYLTRDKGDRVEDLKKAVHCIELEALFSDKIEIDYPNYILDTYAKACINTFARQFDDVAVIETILRFMAGGDYKSAKETLLFFIDEVENAR